ncbi:PilZ domain-containing protein [Sphingomonas sp. NPDC019816]|uniref:PilZ domain-containing protein n=1 Tax=unclassified Sphingomonas TaxID=196159 RepID=UPI00289DE653|nr:PilZ domain-containing protein [Sphingomonas sp.]
MDAMRREPDTGPDGAEQQRDPGNRTQRRDSLLLMAAMTRAGDPTPRDVRVRNISEGGLMAELGVAVEIGSAIMFDLRGIGMVAGRVAWCTQGRIGVAFDRPIDPKLVRKPVGGGTMTPEYAKAATTPSTKSFHS